MKRETLFPFVGKSVIVRDLFGNVSYGTIENVDDETLRLIVNKRGTREIMSLEYIVSVVIEEK